MKRKFLYGLAITTVLAVAGLVNANLGSTTAICSLEPTENLCKNEGFIGSETAAKGSVFQTSAGNVLCTSSMEGIATEPATPKGATLKGLASVQFSECTREGGGACTAKVLQEEWPAVYSWTSGVNGTVEFGSGEAGPPSVLLTCEKVIECSYTFESPFDINGGKAKTATVVASKEVLGSASGALCPGGGAAISLSATYTGFTSFFVGATRGSVRLCTVNESPCSTKNAYATPVTMVASLEKETSAKMKLKITEAGETTEYTVVCDISTLEGKVTATNWPATSQISVLSFGECGGTCAAQHVNPPFSATVDATGGGDGTISMFSRLRVSCIGAYKCTYEGSGLTVPVTGGAPAKLPVSLSINKLVVAESDAKCGSEVKWEGAYRLTKPESGGEAKMWIEREGI